MHTISGTSVDLLNFTPDMVVKDDITHALKKNIRFNGHIEADFTVYEHSMIGAAWAESPRQKLEALLHDTAEAYTGDIILPMKECFPELAEFEDRITAVIFDTLWPDSGLTPNGLYKKSPYMIQLDRDMAACEAFYLRPDHPPFGRALEKHAEWRKYYKQLEDYLFQCVYLDGATFDEVFWDYYDRLLEESDG